MHLHQIFIKVSAAAVIFDHIFSIIFNLNALVKKNSPKQEYMNELNIEYIAPRLESNSHIYRMVCDFRSFFIEQIEKNAGQYIQTNLCFHSKYYNRIFLQKYAKEIYYKILHMHFPVTQAAAAASAAEKNDRNTSNSSSMTYICIQFVCDNGNKATSRFSGT